MKARGRRPADPPFSDHGSPRTPAERLEHVRTLLKRHGRTRLKLAGVGVRAFSSTRHPILVHIVPIRRCNLDCAYCNEYDKVSAPVDTALMLRRIDYLADLRTSMICFSGGEPLLHPDLDRLIARAAERGALAEMLTNAYLLTADRIRRLNDAGLYRLQISIDNVQPDEVSKKSLKVLDKKLQLLARYALFEVNVNSVVGAGIPNPDDALTIARRAKQLGFSTTVGIIHDGEGQLRALDPEARRVYDELRRLGSMPYFGQSFHDNLIEGRPNDWRCRAGARYLYVCEDGLVHYCSQQRGRPGIPLFDYTADHLERAFNTAKPCAPFCTVSCVHTVATFDRWRAPQRPSDEL